MSLIYTCDFCGETIAKTGSYVTLNANGEKSGEHWRTGYVGHYHADPAVGCWTRVLEVIRMEDAPRLDEIPTASYQAITARRRKHRPLSPEDGAAA